jgi:para-aminobenzoate synthetase component 1
MPTVLTRPLAVDPLAAAAGMAGRPGTLLLHGQGAQGGLSALLFSPRWTLRQRRGRAPVWTGQVPAPRPPELPADRLVGQLAATWPPVASPAPVVAGLAGMLGYDLGPARWGVEAPPPPFRLPDAWLGAYDRALLFGDAAGPRLVVVDLVPLVPTEVATALRWEEAADDLHTAARRRPPGSGTRVEAVVLPDRRHHRDAVARIQAHLRAGDVYQVNLTGHATARTDVHPFVAFLHQARRNPVPRAAYLVLDEAVITSHTPELLLRLDHDTAWTAPIKGTEPAGAGDAERLRSRAKDQAEHVMIVDLCRNDLGSVSRHGSVEVEQLMAPLRLHGLVHLVSTIRATVAPSRRPEALPALFPGGSITGAPKRRAMEIIARVEAARRGPYTGSLGHLDRTGRAHWNIAIRTAVWQEGTVAFGCGGGIVLDSRPESEYAEAVLKARSFFDTLAVLGGHGEPVAARRGSSAT